MFTRAGAVFLGDPEGRMAVAVTPATEPSVAASLAALPAVGDRLVVATPAAIRAAMRARYARHLALQATRLVKDRFPRRSADRLVDGRQAVGLAIALFALVVAAGALGPAPLLLAAFGSLGLPLFGLMGLRFVSVIDVRRPPRRRPAPTGDLPRVAVLVPLHREAGLARAVVGAMSRLAYPRDRLEVLFVLEEDDHATRAAFDGLRLPAHMATIVVPPIGPRTKPKALNHALLTVTADVVSVYDAEDRPDPDQLLAAVAAFEAGPPTLGCVQAALAVDHHPSAERFLVTQFALEYAAQFDGLLPVLARLGIPFPLGGTSMHLKRDAILEIGGWDPYNVTEDADMGARLARAGFRIGVIASTTHEEAPITLGAWLRQRTRWLKGWIQTWLAHMREPIAYHRGGGWRGAVLLHVILGGAILTPVVYPASLVVLGLGVADLLPVFAARPFLEDVVLTGFLMTFALGLMTPLLLAVVAVERARRPRRWLSGLAFMPVYWLLHPIALVLAIVDLVRRPHHWAKTEHGRAARGTAGLPPLRPPPRGGYSSSGKRV